MRWKVLKNNSYYSVSEAGKILQVSSGNISQCANGKYNTAYGLKWRCV